MSDNRPTYPIGVNVFAIREGKLLLGRRKGAAGEGQWGLPGGHMESGENMEDTAARELLEETGLTAEKLTFVNLVNDNGRSDHYIQAGFKVEGMKGEVKLMEPDRCLEWKWFPLDALPEEIFYGHTKQIEIFRKNIAFANSKAI